MRYVNNPLNGHTQAQGIKKQDIYPGEDWKLAHFQVSLADTFLGWLEAFQKTKKKKKHRND